MAKTNAERQREYRQRHLREIEGDLGRLDILVSHHTVGMLRRLARHRVVNQRDVLETLLSDAENEVVKGLKSKEQKLYYDGE